MGEKMRFAVQSVAISLFLGISVSNVHAEGDVAVGATVAQAACARCHNVRPLGPFKQYPPSFAAIAAYRSAEEIRWRIVLPPFHSSMPRVGDVLTPDNVDHLVAYITSLEKP